MGLFLIYLETCSCNLFLPALAIVLSCYFWHMNECEQPFILGLIKNFPFAVEKLRIGAVVYFEFKSFFRLNMQENVLWQIPNVNVIFSADFQRNEIPMWLLRKKHFSTRKAYTHKCTFTRTRMHICWILKKKWLADFRYWFLKDRWQEKDVSGKVHSYLLAKFLVYAGNREPL